MQDDLACQDELREELINGELVRPQWPRSSSAASMMI